MNNDLNQKGIIPLRNEEMKKTQGGFPFMWAFAFGFLYYLASRR
jgi:hypothetical protein